MVSPKDVVLEPTNSPIQDVDDDQQVELVRPCERKYAILDKQTFSGCLAINLAAFLLPALYSTLSKLWVANIDQSQVVTTDVYTYLGVVAEVLNEGLPRTAWLVIGDRASRTPAERIGLSKILIAAQIAAGFLLTLVFLAAAPALAATLVPADVRASSLGYVRVSAAVALTSAAQAAIASCTRALDLPDVPLLISSTAVVANILLDMLFLSRFRPRSVPPPTVLSQAVIRFVCDLVASLAGLAYFWWAARAILTGEEARSGSGSRYRRAWTTWCERLAVLARPAKYTFAESAIRNAIYLWLVARIIALGHDYGTAWGVFNTIRWGLIMVPVQALEAATLTFVGHRWGEWKASSRSFGGWEDVKWIVHPALVSSALALAFEVPVCIFLSFWGMQQFAFYLSNSQQVALITRDMWRHIDWCYIFYALDAQLAAVLLATVPRWYLYQALGSNFLWMLPWAVVVTVAALSQDRAWTLYAVIFGGAMVIDFLNVSTVLGLWAWRLAGGKMR